MVYIHVPFCKSFCTYCDFYSEICPANEALRVQNLYVDAVCREIDERREEIARTLETNTLYIGGGTPSVLSLPVLRRIVEHLEDVLSADGRWSRFAIVSTLACRGGDPALPGGRGQRPRMEKRDHSRLPHGFAEFTIEVNPEDIVRGGEAYVRGLLELGVTRVSMGVQSMSDPILRWMNRRHDAATAVEAVRILRSAGVQNLSLDLIFGLSQLDDALWLDTIEKTLELHPEHISAYQLSIEPGSALAGMVDRGEYREAPEEQCARQYEILCKRLAEAGYSHYEISNFALPGFEARHNSAYWRRVPYVGLGPGAHSFEITPDGTEVRSWNPEVIPGMATPADNVRRTETLTASDIRTETMMLGLRTAAGLPESQLRSLCDNVILDRLIAEGALARVKVPEEPQSQPSPGSPQAGDKRIRIPEERCFVADSIILSLI